MRRMGSTTEDSRGDFPAIPDDVGHEFSGEALEWLSRFHVDLPTAIEMGILWSPSRNQIVYKLGNCWQARNFGEYGKKRKNFTSGDVNECLHIFHEASSGTSEVPEKNQLVIVEDPLSALRVAHSGVANAMPLLGSHLAQARLLAIAKLYNEVVFWLDSDKWKEATQIADRAKYLGLSTKVIYTELDPKCYTNEQIREILGADK
jgi:hypothetical protein